MKITFGRSHLALNTSKVGRMRDDILINISKHQPHQYFSRLQSNLLLNYHLIFVLFMRVRKYNNTTSYKI